METKNVHNVLAVKHKKRIVGINFETKSKSKVSVHFDDDGKIVLKINRSFYVIVPENAPSDTVFSSGDQDYLAVVLDQKSTVAKPERSKLVILDSGTAQEGCVFNVDGEKLSATEDTITTADGKTYKEGDTVTIGGRSATLAVVHDTTAAAASATKTTTTS